MLEPIRDATCRARAPAAAGELHTGHPDKVREARVKRDCAELYPTLNPQAWYMVVKEGEYRDDLAGFWIRVDERVTYVLAKHFEVQTRPQTH